MSFKHFFTLSLLIFVVGSLNLHAGDRHDEKGETPDSSSAPAVSVHPTPAEGKTLLKINEMVAAWDELATDFIENLDWSGDGAIQLSKVVKSGALTKEQASKMGKRFDKKWEDPASSEMVKTVVFGLKLEKQRGKEIDLNAMEARVFSIGSELLEIDKAAHKKKKDRLDPALVVELVKAAVIGDKKAKEIYETFQGIRNTKVEWMTDKAAAEITKIVAGGKLTAPEAIKLGNYFSGKGFLGVNISQLIKSSGASNLAVAKSGEDESTYKKAQEYINYDWGSKSENDELAYGPVVVDLSKPEIMKKMTAAETIAAVQAFRKKGWTGPLSADLTKATSGLGEDLELD